MLQDLAGSWSGRDAWTVLDADFDGGSHFLQTCRVWRDDAQAPKVLHYVALAHATAPLHSLAADLAGLGLGDISTELHHLYPGFNRILLADGHIALTLCIGELATALRELRAQADTVVVGTSAALWTAQLAASLALNCRDGAVLYAGQTLHWQLPPDMARHGFVSETPASGRVARFAPRWTPKTSRRLVSIATPPGRCAVIGGGLSGAATARALAVRGWQVTVYDEFAQPANGASGLPVGLCVPLESTDDNPLSRLSHQGVRLTLAHARVHLSEHSDWKPSGVLEHRDPTAGDTLHSHAGWIKPAALVRAWLTHPRICWLGGVRVSGLQRQAHGWVLQGSGAGPAPQADMVVLASAMGCRALVESAASQCRLADGVLQKMEAMRNMHGTLSLGPDHAPAPGIPQNGSGSWISGVPGQTGAFWAAGATYETGHRPQTDVAAAHCENLQKLRALSALHAQTMQSALQDNTLWHWSGTRCVTHDRLPLVGALERAEKPTLWICAGMGSRGMSLAALSAELLAGYIGSEPLPLPARLARSLDVNRPTRNARSDSDSESESEFDTP